MAHLLNYKYEIFPTNPQRSQLYKILRQTRLQWNRAVTIRRKLKRALKSGLFNYLIPKLLSEEKDNNQGQLRKAISNLLDAYPNVDQKQGPRFYDTKNLVGNILDDFGPKYLDMSLLAKTLKEMHAGQVQQRKKDIADGVTIGRQAKLTVYWQLMGAINRYAGYAAKRYMDKSFETRKGLVLSSIRTNISGYAKSIKWNTAVKPSASQRTHGATGEPRYKRRGEGFTFQVQHKKIADLFRTKRRGKGHQVFVNPLHKGNAWIDVAFHRPIPEEGKIKQITINENAGHLFIVFSTEVPEHEWAIIPMNAGWHAGIDPGAHIPLTVALKNIHTGEVRHVAMKYGFIDNTADKLEQVKQRLALKQGRRRHRTEPEVQEAIERYVKKASIRKMKPTERGKAIEKEKARLERTMIWQEASKAWRELNLEVRQLQYKTANQRRDVLHKISRLIVEGCEVVGIGHWEPEQDVGYRKQLRALKKEVKLGVEGAKKKLEALKEQKTKQGPKGARKRRRGGRDLSIATLRRLIEEKAERSGASVFTYLNEAGTTMTCSICGSETGPKNDMSIREWRCGKCNAVHNRDLNNAFNILKRVEEEFAAAQAAASATEHTVTRTKTHGPVQPESDFRFPGRGSYGRGDSNIHQQADVFVPFLWKGEVPRTLNSLIQTNIVTTLTSKNRSQNAEKAP